MKVSTVLPHLHQGIHEAKGKPPQTQSVLRPKDFWKAYMIYALLALKISDCVYDTVLLLVLEVYKSRLLLNFNHRIMECFGLEGVLKII